MASEPGEISRRRVLAGAAWSAPVILLATSVPARAASGDPTGQIIVTSAFAQYQPSYFVNGVGSITATTGSLYATLADASGGGNPNTANLVSITLELTLSSVWSGGSTPLWGFQNTQGNTSQWEVIDGPSANSGKTVTTLRWLGGVVAPSQQFVLEGFFVQTDDTVGHTVDYLYTGVDENGTVLTRTGTITVA